MKCWVTNCDGEHDAFIHPVHNHKPPSARPALRSRLWTCGCGVGLTCDGVGWTEAA